MIAYISTYTFLLFYTAFLVHTNPKIIGCNFKQLNFKCLLFTFFFHFFIFSSISVYNKILGFRRNGLILLFKEQGPAVLSKPGYYLSFSEIDKMAGSAQLFPLLIYVIGFVLHSTQYQERMRSYVLKVQHILWIFFMHGFFLSLIFFFSFLGLTYTFMQNLIHCIN